MTSETSLSYQSKQQTGTTTSSNKIRLRPTHGLASLQLGAIWDYRELLLFLVWRDIKVRYKQTLLGILWVVLQPLIAILIYTVLFGRLLKVPSGDIPYPLFLYAALLPWNYFASSLSRTSNNLVENANLITKVYFPRLIVPLSGVLSGLVDLVIAFAILLLLMAYYGVSPTASLVYLPIFTLLAMATALGVGLWLSALNVRYRDVKYLVPFAIQMWMYVTPVVYGSNLIPAPYRKFLALNPMTAVTEGYRWALFGSEALQEGGWSLELILISVAITLTVLVLGIYFFRTTERTFADII